MCLLMISGDRTLAEGKRGAFYNTLEELHKYWDRVDIICPKTSRGSTSRGFEVEPLFGNIYVHPSPWPLTMQPWWILKKGQKLYREHKFDVITVHEYPPFYNGIGAKMLWGKIQVPYVLEIHHIPGHPKAAGPKEWFYKLAMRHFIKYDVTRAKAMRVVNQYQAPKFLIKAGVPADKIKYISSAYIDLEIFRPMPIEKKHDLVFAARLEKNKGINLLLEAVALIKKQKPDIKLLIIGSGPLNKNLKFKIENLKLHDNIMLAGWLPTADDVARAYNSALIFINPSLNEGGPRVALEAMACGLPVITTPVGVMLDVIKDGENGLFTDWNSQQMADKIVLLLNNQELQIKFSQAGLKLVQQFEKKLMIKNYAEQLKGLVADAR